MATVSQNQFDLIERSHPCWTHSFSGDERSQMLDDDLWAGTSVAGVLIAVITFGLCAIILTLLSTL